MVGPRTKEWFPNAISYILSVNIHHSIKGCSQLDGGYAHRGRRISLFEVSLVYIVRSRTIRATERDPSQRKKKKRKEKTFTQKGATDLNKLIV